MGERGSGEGALLGEDEEVGGVDEGDDEGDVGIAAEVFSVGEDGELGGAKSGFWFVCFLSNKFKIFV